MKITIVIPSYNQGRFLGECIDSILIQNYSNIEVLVFDAGSTDETLDVLKSYGEKIVWVSQPDRGQTDAINRGLQKSTGDILAYLNSDDIYYPGAFDKIIETFSDKPDCMALYGRSNHLKENGDFLEPYNTQPWDYDKLLYECFICQPGTFWRRKLNERFGLFNDRLNYCMDYEYWLRVGKHVSFHYVDDFIIGGSRLYEDNKTLSQRVPVHKEIASMVTKFDCDAAFHWLKVAAHLEFRASISKIENRDDYTLHYSYNLVETVLNFGKELNFPFKKSHLRYLKNLINPS